MFSTTNMISFFPANETSNWHLYLNNKNDNKSEGAHLHIKLRIMNLPKGSLLEDHCNLIQIVSQCLVLLK